MTMTAGKRADLTHIHGNLPTRIAVLSLSRTDGTLGEQQRRRCRDGVRSLGEDLERQDRQGVGQMDSFRVSMLC